MARNASTIPGLAIAGLAFLSAIAVYVFLRADPPALLTALQSDHKVSLPGAWLFGSAPSLLYTLSIGLLLGIVAPNLAAARIHCLGWTAVALLLEFTQHAVFASQIIAALTNHIPGAVVRIIGSYWSQGVFDLLDLLATLAGGLLALAIIFRLTCGGSHVDNR